MEVTSASHVGTALPDSAALQSAAIGNDNFRARPIPESVDFRPEMLTYHLLRPRDAGVADVALLGEAYRCWSEVWSETLFQLDGATDVPSDEFTRQDEIGALFHGYECIALSCFRWIDLALPMHHADSYFRIWPQEARAAAAREGTRVCIGSHITVAQRWRRVRGCSIRHVITALTLDRFRVSGGDAILGTMRDDRGMHKLTAGLGTHALGHAQLHGVPVTLIAFYRSSVRPPLSERQEGIVRGLTSVIAPGGER